MAVEAVVVLEALAILPILHYLDCSELLVHSVRHWEGLHSALTSYAPVAGTVAPLSDGDQTEDVGFSQVAVVPRRPAAPQEGVHSNHCS